MLRLVAASAIRIPHLEGSSFRLLPFPSPAPRNRGPFRILPSSFCISPLPPPAAPATLFCLEIYSLSEAPRSALALQEAPGPQHEQTVKRLIHESAKVTLIQC